MVFSDDVRSPLLPIAIIILRTKVFSKRIIHRYVITKHTSSKSESNSTVCRQLKKIDFSPTEKDTAGKTTNDLVISHQLTDKNLYGYYSFNYFNAFKKLIVH